LPAGWVAFYGGAVPLAPRETGSGRAFTLVEIMMTVVIIGLLAAIAILVALHAQHRARDARFVSDIRTFAQAFETYATKTGTWPPDANRGMVPTGMSGELNDGMWKSRNSLSGLWDWDYKQNGYTAAISTVEVTVNDDEMAEIDAKIDDGNLATGNFVKIGSNRYSYILQK
jgi:prepilin-type N-terminal cleavage/methylation domain-containing protein